MILCGHVAIPKEDKEVTFDVKVLEHSSGNYLKKKTQEHLVKAILYAAIFMVLLLISTPRLPTHIIPEDYDNTVTLFTIVPAIGLLQQLRLYNDSKRGIEGERRVAQLLKEKFDDNYYLINDVEYVYDNKGHKANIDHIVLGPNGVFAIETKDYKGEITYKKDYWDPPFSRSPSKQARYNYSWVKKTIDASGVLDYSVWVYPIVVFSNPNAKLTTIDPEIEVVELKDLPESIESFKKYNFSSEQLKLMVEVLMKN